MTTRTCPRLGSSLNTVSSQGPNAIRVPLWTNCCHCEARILVSGRSVDGHPVETISRFIAGLKVGETVEIDVAHRSGETLTILELTEPQRGRVAQ